MQRMCKKCGKTKPLAEFASNNSCNFNKEHRCKDCKVKHNKSYAKTDNGRKLNNKYQRKRRKINEQYRISQCLRSRLNKLLLFNSSEEAFIRLVGCNSRVLYNHITSQFESEMNWENRGEIWEIDHIKPYVSFNLTDQEQVNMCCHFSNIRPCYIAENRKKSLEDKKSAITPHESK